MNKMLLVVFAVFLTVSNAFAKELYGFQGCRFGTKVSDGNFSGPDEDGDYFFIPEGKKPSLTISYVASVTHTSKKVYAISIFHAMTEFQVKASFLQYFNLLDKNYGRIGKKADKKIWLEYFSSSKQAYPELKRSEYAVWEFKNDADETCQVMQLFVKRELGLAIVCVVCEDIRLSKLDDEEKLKASTKTHTEKLALSLESLEDDSANR